jgi:hypothetical protein
MEVGSSMPEMIDASKVCDLAILAIDCTKGLEMEQFEFLNMLQVHGMPRVMGALTFMDNFSDAKALKKRRKALKRRFETEVGPGAKLFHFAGLNTRATRSEMFSILRASSLLRRPNHFLGVSTIRMCSLIAWKTSLIQLKSRTTLALTVVSFCTDICVAAPCDRRQQCTFAVSVTQALRA